MSYQTTLASNFPADCRIPHLENNLYIYGAGPLHKQSLNKYSSSRYPVSKDDQALHSRGSFHDSSPYSQSKSNKSTNPYTIPTNDSPSTGFLVQKTNELRDKRLEINERESRIFHTPENPSYPKYEKFEQNDSYSNINRSAKRATVKDSSLTRENRMTMQEFQLFQEGSDQLKLVDGNRLMFQEMQRKQFEEQEKNKRIQEFERNARCKREQEIEREKQELEHFLAIKKSEEIQREREKEEYHNFLMKKQEEAQNIEKEKNRAENLRKIQIEQEIQRKQAEENQKFHAERAELIRQEEIRKFEYEKALQVKRQEEFERSEFEKVMHRKRLEESMQADNERVLQQRNQDYQRAEYEKERKKREELEEVQRARLEERRRVEESEKIDQRLRHEERLENLSRIREERNRSGLNERQLALKEEIGRESRQFCREKDMKNQNSNGKNKFSSPRTTNNDPLQPSSEGKTKVSSSKSLNDKIRSLSARKNEPHYHQPTFSTKVKSMGNQSYKFAGAYRTGFK